MGATRDNVEKVLFFGWQIPSNSRFPLPRIRKLCAIVNYLIGAVSPAPPRMHVPTFPVPRFDVTGLCLANKSLTLLLDVFQI